MLKAIVLNTRWVSCVVCELHLKAVKDLVSMVGVGETGEGGKACENVRYLELGDGHMRVYTSKFIGLYTKVCVSYCMYLIF